MSDFNDAYKEMARLALTYRPSNLHHIEILHKWFDAAAVEHGEVHFKKADGAELENRMDWDNYKKISKILYPLKKSIRASQEALGHKINIFKLLVDLDGSYTVHFEYDDQLDAREEAETRAAIGDELYERYEREDRERREREKACPNEDAQARDQPVESVKQEVSPMTQDELMSFLYWEVTEDAPAGWERVVVEAEVKTDASGHRHIHVAYRYYLAGDDTAHRFTTKNVIGPMNAISELEELMAAEGKGWQKGRFELLPERRFTFTPES